MPGTARAAGPAGGSRVLSACQQLAAEGSSLQLLGLVWRMQSRACNACW